MQNLVVVSLTMGAYVGLGGSKNCKDAVDPPPLEMSARLAPQKTLLPHIC